MSRGEAGGRSGPPPSTEFVSRCVTAPQESNQEARAEWTVISVRRGLARGRVMKTLNITTESCNFNFNIFRPSGTNKQTMLISHPRNLRLDKHFTFHINTSAISAANFLAGHLGMHVCVAPRGFAQFTAIQ